MAADGRRQRARGLSSSRFIVRYQRLRSPRLTPAQGTLMALQRQRHIRRAFISAASPLFLSAREL